MRIGRCGLFVRGNGGAARRRTHLHDRVDRGRGDGIDEEFKDEVESCAPDDEEVQDRLTVGNEVRAQRVAHEKSAEDEQARIDDRRRKRSDDDARTVVLFADRAEEKARDQTRRSALDKAEKDGEDGLFAQKDEREIIHTRCTHHDDDDAEQESKQRARSGAEKHRAEHDGNEHKAGRRHAEFADQRADDLQHDDECEKDRKMRDLLRGKIPVFHDDLHRISPGNIREKNVFMRIGVGPFRWHLRAQHCPAKCARLRVSAYIIITNGAKNGK